MSGVYASVCVYVRGRKMGRQRNCEGGCPLCVFHHKGSGLPSSENLELRFVYFLWWPIFTVLRPIQSSRSTRLGIKLCSLMHLG